MRAARWKLLGIVALFAAPILVSVVLRAVGWQPVGTRQHGELVQPPVDLGAAWVSPEGKWRVVLKAPEHCGQACVEAIDTLQRVWLGLGRRAARAEIVFGGAPEPAVAARLKEFPQARVVALDNDPFPAAVDAPAALPVYVVDHHGYWVLRYDAGFAPRGLTKDLERVLR